MNTGDVLLLSGAGLGLLAIAGMAAAGLWLAWQQRKGGAA
jgi:hypothetical protein